MKTSFSFILTLFVLLLSIGWATAQIAQKGTPIQVQKLKSQAFDTDLVTMPAVNNAQMRALYNGPNQDILKPFKFAHSFDVSLNLKNSGTWYSTSEVNVWQLRVRSVGAYSLNLIFDRYILPDGARLFLISTQTGEIKGAYTSANNSDSHIFAIEPVAGDELLVQYEEPTSVEFPGELSISKVAHDYSGILYNDHRPLNISSGSCNVNVNCNIGLGVDKLRDGVCRIIVAGSELCTGSLINNTSLDGTPYVITAYHCLKNEIQAQSSIFLFNHESPSCETIDGDVSRSLSGSSMKASFDSLDFSLVRLNQSPPEYFRPYLVGWNRKKTAPGPSFCIHHPVGDIKKISIDKDVATTSKFSSAYLNNGFWKISEWESGVTEVGSSGAPLFDQNKLLVGTLTGGASACPPSLPTNDYFEKFSLAWDYRKEASKQLKVWLDPLSRNVEKLEGMDLSPTQMLCKSSTNFTSSDKFEATKIPLGAFSKNYWTGTNSEGITEFAEKFTGYQSCEISGITLGVAKVKVNPLGNNPSVSIMVYEGTDKPEKLIRNEKFNITKLYGNAMNHFYFSSPVKTTGNFFVSCNISIMNAGDSLVVYMAKRNQIDNSLYLKDKNGWKSYNSKNLEGNGSALLAELVACKIIPTSNNIIDKSLPEARFYPNPLFNGEKLYVDAPWNINSPENIAVYDLLGTKQAVKLDQLAPDKVSIDFAGMRPGIYFVHLQSGSKKIVGKVSYIP